MQTIDYKKFQKAIDVAIEIHGEQKRKSDLIPGTPYLSHLLRVATNVMECNGDTDQICAALLHDAIEDGGSNTRALIRERLGSNVENMVDGCTEKGTEGDGPKPPWKQRKDEYLKHIKKLPLGLLLIVASDKDANCYSIINSIQERGESVYLSFVKEYPEEERKEATLWFYRSCLEACRARWSELAKQCSTEDERLTLIGINSLLWNLDRKISWLDVYPRWAFKKENN